MKRLSFLLIFGAALLFFFGCQKDNPLEPTQGEQLTPELKVERVSFEGVCQNPAILYCGDIQELPNGMIKVMNFESEWEDYTNDPMTTGKSHWFENFIISKTGASYKFWGKATLTTDFGEWEYSMHGYSYAQPGYVILPPCAGPPVPSESDAYVHAVGKSGAVKGMVGEFRYYMDWQGFPQPFEWVVTGWYQNASP
jgi:hypothetical protein